MKIYKLKAIIFLILLTTGVNLSRSQQVTPDSVYTLDQCVAMALENNRKGISARNNLSAAVDLRREALTKYFPEIGAAGMIFWANHDILQYNLLDIIELGIIKKGKVAGVQAVQPVFMGGQIVNGNKLAKVGEEVAEIRRQQTDNELRVTTESLYWKLVTLQSTRGALETAISFLDSLDRQVNAAVEAGVVTRNDLLKVQLKRNSYRTELVDLDNGIQLVKMLLGQYIGQGIEGQINVVGAVADSLPPFPIDLFTPTSEALPMTSDYRLLQSNVKAKDLEKKMEIGRNLPSVTVGAGWYYHDLLEQNHNFGSVQIGVDVPLTAWWSGAYSIKRKNVELVNARNELEDLSEKLQIEMQDKWNNLTAAHRKMAIEKEGIGQSAENLRLNQMYYDAGMSTISDLLEAEAEHKQAKDRFIAAYGAFCVARAEYLVATGR